MKLHHLCHQRSIPINLSFSGMFTHASDIRRELSVIGYKPEEMSFVQRGVMTDKFMFSQGGQRYIARCYPPGREWLAEMEYRYLKLFESFHAKVPKTCQFKKDGQAMLVYEMLEGYTLSEVYETLSDAVKETLCRDIVIHYKKISGILETGFGQVTGYQTYAHTSWNDFLSEAIAGAATVFKTQGNKEKIQLCCGLSAYAKRLPTIAPSLVWGDLSTDNIIVKPDGTLVGFIDFEGLIAGDPLFGLGHLIAHEQETDFVNRLFRLYGVDDRQRVDFYAVLRYCRLLPYGSQKLPNGAERMPIEQFLPYAYKRIRLFMQPGDAKGNIRNGI